jgi:hypothetical protein
LNCGRQKQIPLSPLRKGGDPVAAFQAKVPAYPFAQSVGSDSLLPRLQQSRIPTFCKGTRPFLLHPLQPIQPQASTFYRGHQGIPGNWLYRGHSKEATPASPPLLKGGQGGFAFIENAKPLRHLRSATALAVGYILTPPFTAMTCPVM